MATETLARLLRVIRSSLAGQRGLHISGGEPFMDTARLETAIHTFTSAGVNLEFVETNGFWGRDIQRAVRTLRRLHQVGLRRLRLSATPFHEPFVPLPVVKNAYEAACRVFGHENVFVFDYAFLRAGLNDSVAYDLICGGRAGYLAAMKGFPLRSAQAFAAPCHDALLRSGHAHFDGNGNMIPGVCTGIYLGHYTELAALIHRVDLTQYPILQRLAEGGPASLWAYARSEYGIHEPPGGFVGPCHCCVDVRRRLLKTRLFKELGPLTFYMALDRLNSVQHPRLRWDASASEIQ